MKWTANRIIGLKIGYRILIGIVPQSGVGFICFYWLVIWQDNYCICHLAQLALSQQRAA